MSRIIEYAAIFILGYLVVQHILMQIKVLISAIIEYRRYRK
jgi:hypothetical protein